LEADQIRQLLIVALPDCEIDIEGGDGKYLVTATGQVFEGLNAVRRQQTIYQILGEHISSGTIHAITMHLMTAAERDAV